MNTIRYTPVYFGIYLLLCTAVLSLTFFMRIPLFGYATALVWPLLYGAGLFCGWKFSKSGADTYKALGGGVMVLGLLIFLLLFFEGRRELAILTFLLAIQGAHTFTLAQRRDFYFAFVVSLIIILYAASITRSTAFIFALSLYVVVGLFALMTSLIDEKLARAESADRDLLRRQFAVPVKGFGVAVLILFMAFVLYLFVPRPPSLNIKATPYGGTKFYKNEAWEKNAHDSTESYDLRARDAIEDSTGGERSVQGNSSGRRKHRLEHDPNLTGYGDSYATDGQEPDRDRSFIIFYLKADRPLYVRAKSYDHFDGGDWHNSYPDGLKLSGKNGLFRIPGLVMEGDVHQTYIIEAPMTDSILAAYRPVNVWFPANVIDVGINEVSGFAMRAPEPLVQGTKYSVSSAMSEIMGHPAGPRDILLDRSPYLQIPQGSSPRIRQLALSVAGGAGNDIAKAIAIEDHLRLGYEYTTETVFRQGEGNVVEEFLFDLRRGHCEYFASSMVMMLRELGIPARMSVGYAATTYNPVTGYFEVRNKNAHAWVEAYFDEYGWVTFEPTPASELPHKTDRTIAAGGISSYTGEMMDMFVRDNPDSLMAMLLIWLRIALEWLKLIASLVYLWAKTMFFILMGWFMSGGWIFLAAAIILTGGLILIYRKLRPVLAHARLLRLKKASPERFIVACFFELERLFRAQGIKRPSHTTTSEFERQLVRKFATSKAQIRTVIRSFELAVYSQLPPGAADAENVYAAFTDIREMVFSAERNRD